VDLQLGRLTIDETGFLAVGSRSDYHSGNFQLTLNSSLLPQLPSHLAVSTIDVHGTLQLWSTDLEVEDQPVRNWKAVDFSTDSFVVETDDDPVEFSPGTTLGLVSSHGDEVVTVKHFDKGKVQLQGDLQVNHGKNAIVYQLSRKIKIKAAGSAVLRVWNGRHHAGGGVDPLAPPDAHGHRKRRLQTNFHTPTSSIAAYHTSAPVHSCSSTFRRGLRAENDSAVLVDKVSDSGYSDSYIYRTSLLPDDTGGVVELHGVEIAGLGLEGEFASKAALEFVDHACAVRWPGYRKYITLMSTTLHSLPAGCVLFDGCTGGFEVWLLA
jgi:hypothetical protein